MACSAVTLKTLEEHVNCPVCLEQKELRLLPCQHRLCLPCLSKFTIETHFNFYLWVLGESITQIEYTDSYPDRDSYDDLV